MWSNANLCHCLVKRRQEEVVTASWTPTWITFLIIFSSVFAHLFTTLKENKEKLLIVDWYKNEQPTKRVEEVIQVTLDKDLPISYDKPSFDAKTKLILNHFIDMAVQGYGWIVA